MCTVTIIPKGKNDFILTSNRDEAPERQSLSPEYYDIEGNTLLFPKDILSGGTWIGVSEKNRLICVLNGGFIKHKRKEVYRKSRGIVAKDFLLADKVVKIAKSYNLDDIEPFTMIIVDWNPNLKLFELVWDGQQTHFKELVLEPKIWSSTTLYTDEMIEERRQWLKDYKKDNKLDANGLLQFHKSAGNGNIDYGVVMDRGYVKTTSISQVIKEQNVIHFHYQNLQNGKVTDTVFNLHQTVNE